MIRLGPHECDYEIPLGQSSAGKLSLYFSTLSVERVMYDSTALNGLTLVTSVFGCLAALVRLRMNSS